MKKALAALPGVTKVEVDYDSKIATCSYEGETFDGVAATEALKTAGFPDSKMKPEAAVH